VRAVTPTDTQTKVATTTRSADTGGRPPQRDRLESAWDRVWTYAKENPMLVGFIVVGLIARIVFWAVTDRKLDDAMITIKFDKNLADGFGLVHNLGEGHVQGFTSALSVLVPLPGELVYHGGGFLLIRLVSMACFALAAIYAYRIASELGLGQWPTAFALAYLALDQNQVFFGVAGMETQIAVAVLLGGMYYVLVEDYPKSGVALGLAVLARPDFVLWVAPAYVFLIIRNHREALRAAAISAAIVAPWVIFTWAYYGSPVPNTVTAKNNAFVPNFPGLTHPHAWVNFLGDQLAATATTHSWTLFAPFWEDGFLTDAPLAYGAAKTIALIVAALAIVGAISTLRRASWLPAIAYLLLFVAYKVFYLNGGGGYFDWYGVPAVAVLVLMATVGLDRVSRWVSAAMRGRLSPAVVATLPALLLALIYAWPLPYRTVVEARTQHDIENKVRDPLSRYLGEVVRPGQTITSESSGYVGYYTNGTLYDYPGLESPTVVSALQKADESGHLVFGTAGTASLLHPVWLVLRPDEVALLRSRYPETARQYSEVRRFSVPGGFWGSICAGGFCVFNIDRDFAVFRRRD
jgi:hypothetical protein